MRGLSTFVSICLLGVALAAVSDDWAENKAQTLTEIKLKPELASPLVAIEASAAPANHVFLDFDHAKFAELRHALTLSNQVTLKDLNGHDLELSTIEHMKPGTKVNWVEADGTEEARAPQEMISLSGKVVGDEDSFAVINLSPDNSFGFIHTSSNKLWLEAHKDSHALLVDITAQPDQDSDILDSLRKNFAYDEVKTETHDMTKDPKTVVATNLAEDGWNEKADEKKVLTETTRDVKAVIYAAIECDKSCYDRIAGEGFTDVERYLRAITAATSAVYQRDLGRELKISYMKINKNQNEYGSHSSDLGNILAVYAQQYNRVKRAEGVCFDVTHLFTGSGSGGLAAKGSVCQKSDNNGGVSTIFGKWKGETTSSASNWDLIVSLHEIGHNLGSPHTHSYNPPLDHCVACDPAVEAAKGTCGGSDAKPVARTDARCQPGTIMSYCHLCGGNDKIMLRFSAQEQAVMEAATATNCGPAPGETPPPCVDQNSGCSSWLASNGVGFCAWNLNSPVQGAASAICCATCSAAMDEQQSCSATSGADTWYTPAAVCKDGSANQCPGWANGGYCNGGTISDGTPISQYCAESCGTCTAGSSTSSTGSSSTSSSTSSTGSTSGASSTSASADTDTNCPSYISQYGCDACCFSGQQSVKAKCPVGCA